jgi:hypothetical protein
VISPELDKIQHPNDKGGTRLRLRPLRGRLQRLIMNRATAVIADWDAAVGTESATRGVQLVASQATVSKLKEAVTKLREENTTRKRKKQAALTVIAEQVPNSNPPAAMSQRGPSHP